MPHPFFIIGVQRSGTTLVRLMLNKHSLIAVPEEADFWIPLLRRYGSCPDAPIPSRELTRFLTTINDSKIFGLWGVNIHSFAEIWSAQRDKVTLSNLMCSLYQYFADQHNKTVWGDKTPTFFPLISTLANVFPDARFVHIVRDGRDVFLSRRKYDRSHRNIAVAALEWRYKVTRALRDLGSLPSSRTLTLRYEDLVGFPIEHLRECSDLIGVDFEASMLEFWRDDTAVVRPNHSSLISSPVTNNSVGRWRRELSPSELGVYEAIAGSVLRRLGYEVCESRVGFRSSVNAAGKLLMGLPSRASQRAVLSYRLRKRYDK